MITKQEFEEELENLKIKEDGKIFIKRQWGWLVVGVVSLVIAGVILLINSAPVSQPAAEADLAKIVKPVNAAEFNLEAKSEEWLVGKEVLVEVIMDTKSANLVVGQAVITYDPARLQYLGSEDQESVLTMKAIDKHEPGRIELVRAQPGDGNDQDSDDGFTGVGKFVALKFKILRTGEVEINFDERESMLIRDDGKATLLQTTFRGIRKAVKQ